MTTGQLFFVETKVSLWNFQGQRFYKTRTTPLFTAVVFLGLAAACIAHWTTGTSRAAILLAFKLFSPSTAYAFHEQHATSLLEKSNFVRLYSSVVFLFSFSKSSWILRVGFFIFFNSRVKEGKNKREEQCYIWVSHHQHSTCVKPQLSGTSLPAGVVGVSLLPAALAILSYADMTYCRTTQQGRRSTCAASI